MMNLMVKSKIHRATVTDGNLNYKGSITIDETLMKAARLRPFEFVHVNNLSNAAHWETYVIPGKKGEIILNGPPARLFQSGDKVVILGFSYLTEEEMPEFTHVDVIVTDTNELIEVFTQKA